MWPKPDPIIGSPGWYVFISVITLFDTISATQGYMNTGESREFWWFLFCMLLGFATIGFLIVDDIKEKMEKSDERRI